MPLPVEQAVNPHVIAAAAYWGSLRAHRLFPARGDLTLRGMAAILPYAVIISVIGDGADFEYRYVGEEQRQAFKTSFKGLRLSQIEAAVPQLGAVLREVYSRAHSLRTPFLIRGRIDHDPADPRLIYHETAFLPLGVEDEAVDHLLVVGVQVPEPFWDIPADRLTMLESGIRAARLSASNGAPLVLESK